jgi:hypothetical protein
MFRPNLTILCAFLLFQHTSLRVRPAPGIPCALLLLEDVLLARLGRFSRRENEESRHCERSEAIQNLSRETVLDCFVAEPVIGPAQAGRTRWLLAMTTVLFDN